MNQWLARLAFSFLVLAALLAWTGYQELTTRTVPNKVRVGLYFVGAGMSLGVAVRGFRERHRGEHE
jgi:Flp pilus assembly protein protease CpaA